MDRVEFRYARPKLVGYLLLAGAFVAVGLGVLLAGGVSSGSFAGLLVWLGVLFFGACAGVILARLVETGPVVVVDPAGVLDTRFSATQVPWTEIEDIRLHSIEGQTFIVLSMNPGFEASLVKTRLAAWLGAPNAALGFPGLAIAAHGLDGTIDDIVKAIRRFCER